MTCQNLQKTATALLFFALTELFIINISTVCAAGLRPSETEPTRLAWISDPQTLYVRPGNSGALLFNDAATSPPSNLQPWQDEYCNATWIDLDSPEYTTRLTAQFDEKTTQSAWTRLESWMGSLAFNGTALFWIIDDDFVYRSQTEPALVDRLTSQIARYARRGIPEPALILQPSSRTPDCVRLIDRLRDNGFNGMIGARFTNLNQSYLPVHGWDFIVYDTSIIPETYRGQAAAGWVRSRHGEVPVILAPSDFNFQRDMVWIASGAAGIWYPTLPATPKDNAAAAVHLRAATTFLNRFPGTWLSLAPRPSHPAFNFVLEDRGRSWAAFIPSTAPPVSIPAPAGLAGKLVGSTWYNPATDQTIIQPLTRLPAVISVQRPDANLWIYTLSAAPPQAENSTHIAPIQDWP